jgi:cytochrome P450
VGGAFPGRRAWAVREPRCWAVWLVVPEDDGPPKALLPAVREELVRMNPSVALTNIQTTDDLVDAARSRGRWLW